jgi:hypothetical protein
MSTPPIDRPAQYADQYADQKKVPKPRTPPVGVVAPTAPTNPKIQKAPIVISQDTMDDLREIDMDKVNRRVAKQAAREGEAKRKAFKADPIGTLIGQLGPIGTLIGKLGDASGAGMLGYGGMSQLENNIASRKALVNGTGSNIDKTKKRLGKWLLQ